MRNLADTKRRNKGTSKYFDDRKGAFKTFKQDYKIPTCEQPVKVVKPNTADGERYGLDERNIRLYIFKMIKNLLGRVKREETHLREDKEAFYIEKKGTQMEHFNAGHAGEKLKDHYYFKKKKR